MEQNRITIDTHALIWSVDEALNHKLSPLANRTIIEAEKSGMIYVPTKEVSGIFSQGETLDFRFV